MKRQTQFILATLLCLIYEFTYAQLSNNQFEIRHLEYNEGLSSQRVFSIIEEKTSGAIWIGTKVGIDRYNGSQVKHYSLSGQFYYGDLAGRRIYLIYNQEHGILAYDQTGKIYQFSPSEDRFKLIINLTSFIKTSFVLNTVHVSSNGSFWFGLDKGLYKKENNQIIAVCQDCFVNNIVTSDTETYIGTSTGVLKLCESQIRPITDLLKVQTLHIDKEHNQLWIGTLNNGVFTLDFNSLKINKIKNNNSSFLNPIRAIVPYDDKTILAGVDGGGVFTIDTQTQEASILMNTEDTTQNYLKGNGVYALTIDKQGNIWIGSYTGGVSIAIASRASISTITHEKGNPQSIANNNINDIEEHANGNIWYATDFGISIYNPESGKWHHTLKNKVAVSLEKESVDHIWVGTYGNGIYLLDSNGNEKKHLTQQQGQLTTNYILSVCQDVDGDVWIGGLDGNLVQLTHNGTVKRTYNIKWVQSIHIMDKDRIAVATVNGFFIIHKKDGAIKHYASSKEFRDQNISSYIISMYFNHDDTVWLGTEGGGLNLYNIKTGESKVFTIKDGLPSDDIYSIYKDHSGKIWVSTGKGLATIDSFQINNMNYISDVEREYNKSSFTKTKDGKIVFGSTSGAVFITPRMITNKKYEAPLHFTEFTVEYRDSTEREYLKPLLYSQMNKGAIELDYSHNSFIVCFESINFHYQRDIVYQSILEGYDKNWSKYTSNGQVQYTRVSPGDYTLSVRSLRRSDGQVISENKIFISIAQPWWNSWWAWTLYVCSIGTLFYFILQYKRNQLQKKHNEDKIKFFINTAHDIRTPVTLIMAPLEDLCKESDIPEKAVNLLRLVRNNTQKLNSLISQLLEFERFDSNKSKSIPVSICMNDFLTEEAASFQSYCEQKNLQLNLQLPKEDIYIYADKTLIGILLDNLISNACKYTPKGGDITITLTANRKTVTISIQDSGIGIPNSAKKYLFKDIYRAQNARESNELGTGFGLLQVHRILKMLHGKINVKSEENKGTLFTISLKRLNDNNLITKQKPTEINKLQTDLIDENLTFESNEIQNDQALNTILIVEDHDSLRYYLRKTFEKKYKVIDVANAQEALNYLSEEYPDLIISDIMMPGIPGDEFCQKVKENPDTSGIPVILLTAKVSHDSMIEGLKKGADDYIPKPFSTEVLRLKVHSIIETRNRQREIFLRQALELVQQQKPGINLSIDEQEKTPSLNEPEQNQENSTIDIGESDKVFIHNATQIVIEHIDDCEFGILQLCQEMAMSRTLFYNRLKSLTGKGPQEFIRLIRLERAAELLRNGIPVSEVVLQAGFANAKYFSSLFKKQYGVQPSKYHSSKEN